MNVKIKILYLGEKEDVGTEIKNILKKHDLNCHFKQINVISEFISHLEDFSPDILLCDGEFKDHTALEILRLNQQTSQKNHFILLVDSFSEESLVQLAKAGMEDYIFKDRLHLLPGAILSCIYKQNRIQKNGPAEQENGVAENLLRKSEANLRTIFDNTNVAYVLSDRKFRVISYNPSALKIYKKEFKVDLKEGDNLLDYLPDERKILSKERFEKALSGEKVNYELHFVQPQGTKTWYNVNMFAVKDKVNNLLGFIISSEDITARKNIELERTKMLSDIVQHNKDLEQFSYIVSHNLRSPVANIIGLSNIIKETPDMNPQDFTRCVDGMVLSAVKLDEIISDLNFILQKRREINEKKEMVTFSSLLNDVKSIISELIDRENILINSNFTVNKIFTVRSYLHSIFLNLITNSIKYRNRSVKTVIDIHSYKVDNKIILKFKDNGLGIDMKNYGDKLFGLYKKFHTHIEGKGMGLYMVKTQVEILGGKITVQSQVGQGTEFTIEFEL